MGLNLDSGKNCPRLRRDLLPNPQQLPGGHIIDCPLLQVCVHLDGLNAFVFFFTKPISDGKIMVKCLNIGKNIGKPIYRSISASETQLMIYGD